MLRRLLSLNRNMLALLAIVLVGGLSCSTLREAQAKEGCQEIFDLIKANWSFNEPENRYHWAGGPMSLDGDMRVQDRAECFQGLKVKQIKAVFGEPTRMLADTVWAYSYGPSSLPEESYTLTVKFTSEKTFKGLKISSQSLRINRDN